MITNNKPILFFCISFFFFSNLPAQMITGTWHGKINRQKVEVKIIQIGDSLTGTSYYYESANNYRRYSIKGYFDKNSNEAVWWDDRLIEEKSGKFNLSSPGDIAMLSRADFNCPGGGIMMLDGKAATKDDEKPKGNVHLDKVTSSNFEDEWDFVIANYTTGANDPDIIDSVSLISFTTVVPEPTKPIREEKTVTVSPPVTKNERPVIKKETPVVEKQETKITEPLREKKITPPTIDEKFASRQKSFVKEIPVHGDSIELRFYDNAEIDGDSISLFLNDKLVFTHIRLAAEAYTIKLSVAELKDSNELTMVAENLGSIPPNTSYMVAIVGDKRYDAQLASTENSSAMIRLVKKK